LLLLALAAAAAPLLHKSALVSAQSQSKKQRSPYKKHSIAAEAQRLFVEGDSNANRFMDAGEVQVMIDRYGVPSNFDWRSCDRDGDGNLNEQEFRNTVAAVKKKERRQR